MWPVGDERYEYEKHGGTTVEAQGFFDQENKKLSVRYAVVGAAGCKGLAVIMMRTG